MKYPVSMPDITNLEKEYVLKTMSDGWISSQSPIIKDFESAWAKINNQSYGVACSSGTAAIVLALRAIDIRPGDEVIVPDFTMIATAWAVTYCGATPVFVDCKDDLTIDPKLIYRAITPRTKAIIPVHIYGRQADMDRIMQIAYEYNLRVIEDSAEAHGIRPRGDIACFSLFANKIISSGEGGICLTNDKRLADQMVHLRGMAFNPEHTFLHRKIGYNFRMTGMQGAVALAQTERFQAITEKRKQIEQWYDEYLKDFTLGKRDVLWMYDIVVANRDELVEKLKENGIETRVFFKPMRSQPMYQSFPGEMAEYYSKVGLYLPTHNNLKKEDVRYISKITKKYAKKIKK